MTFDLPTPATAFILMTAGLAGLVTSEHITSIIVLAGGALAYLRQNQQHKTLVAKVDENTKVNDKQIHVANNVNQKLLETTMLAADANKVAVISSQDLLAAIAKNSEAIAEVRGMVMVLAGRVGSVPELVRAA